MGRRFGLCSGQRLIGVPSTGRPDGSILPKIVVAAGTTNAVVDGVDPDSFEFSPGAATQANCFARIHHARGGIVSSGASLEGNPENLVGFAMALPGITQGRPYLHSHMLAVNPEYRNRGIGRRLKLFQRDEALRRGRRHLVQLVRVSPPKR